MYFLKACITLNLERNNAVYLTDLALKTILEASKIIPTIKSDFRALKSLQ